MRVEIQLLSHPHLTRRETERYSGEDVVYANASGSQKPISAGDTIRDLVGKGASFVLNDPERGREIGEARSGKLDLTLGGKKFRNITFEKCAPTLSEFDC